MLTERLRKDPGKPVEFTKFIVLSALLFSIFQLMTAGKLPSTSATLIFAVLSYFVYRYARLQPGWEKVTEFLENLEKQNSQSSRQQKDLPPVVPPLVLPDHSRSSYARISAEKRRQSKLEEERLNSAAVYAEPTDLSAGLSSVGTRQKTIRQKLVRQKTDGREKRR
jgi:hypothetical protein